MVSKKKKRLVFGDFDLDMSHITHNIIAMGFPSEGYQKVYRNPMEDLQKFFKELYNGRYKIYNLCCEKGWQYRKEKFENRVSTDF
jgi:phosphatidylinositol-3,4,5-trisphosphate 3-phosphatase and dual-specificity protein phosphatase PTEN